MTIAYIDEIVEEYAKNLFKSRDKDYKSVCKGNSWSDLTKLIDYKKLRYLFIYKNFNFFYF